LSCLHMHGCVWGNIAVCTICTKYDIINQSLNISFFTSQTAMHFLLGNVFRENKNKLTVSHFIKVMEMQIIQLLELLILS
jgi:hypothetical protein